MRVTASASDAGGSGIASVTFYLDGNVLGLGTAQTSQYTLQWNTKKATKGAAHAHHRRPGSRREHHDLGRRRRHRHLVGRPATFAGHADTPLLCCAPPVLLAPDVATPWTCGGRPVAAQSPARSGTLAGAVSRAARSDSFRAWGASQRVRRRGLTGLGRRGPSPTPVHATRSLGRAGLGPRPARGGAGLHCWRGFLRAQAQSMLAVDFFTVETVTLQRLDVRVFIELRQPPRPPRRLHREPDRTLGHAAGAHPVLADAPGAATAVSVPDPRPRQQVQPRLRR